MVLSKTQKILVSISVAFIIAISMTFVFLKDNHIDRVEVGIEKEIEFYTKKIEPEGKKIFVLGSSHIMSINTTLIENNLSEKNYHYNVYNLAKGGDVPKDRIPTLDYLIDTKPDMVIYGIAQRDFRGTVPIYQESSNILDSPLPNFKNIFDEAFWKIEGINSEDYEFLSNPKLTTLVFAYNFMKSIIGEEEEVKENRKNTPPFENTPFFRIGEKETMIRSENEIKNIFNNIYKFKEIPDSYKNPQVSSFKEIIKKLQDNNIEVIIFVTPHHKIFQDSFPKKIKTQFNSILDEIEKEYDLEIYSLFDKYNGLQIWNNPSHVAVNEESMIFTEDIIDLISKELDN